MYVRTHTYTDTKLIMYGLIPFINDTQQVNKLMKTIKYSFLKEVEGSIFTFGPEHR